MFIIQKWEALVEYKKPNLQHSINSQFASIYNKQTMSLKANEFPKLLPNDKNIMPFTDAYNVLKEYLSYITFIF